MIIRGKKVQNIVSERRGKYYKVILNEIKGKDDSIVYENIVHRKVLPRGGYIVLILTS